MRSRTFVMRSMAAVMFTIGVLVVSPGVASACSCAPPEIGENLARMDGAFVGTFLEKGEADPNGQEFANVPYRFEVEQWIKGEAGSGVSVWSSQDGGSCGIEARPGQRVGLFVSADNGRLTSDLCSQINPDMLLAAIADDVVVGEGPVHFAVPGAFEEGSIAMLDSLGRPLGYLGSRAEWGPRVYPCRGGTTLVVLNGDSAMEVVDLISGQSRTVDAGLDPEREFVTDVFCDSPDASTFRFLSERFVGNQTQFNVWEYSSGAQAGDTELVGMVPSSPGARVRLAGNSIFMAEQNEGAAQISLIDPATGASVFLAGIQRDEERDNFAGYETPYSSPDGTKVAISEVRYAAGDALPEGALIVVDVAAGRIIQRLEYQGEAFGGAWLNDEAIGLQGHDGQNASALRVFEVSTGNVIAELEPWEPFANALVGDQVWGVGPAGIQTASLATGETRIAHIFPAQTAGTILAFDDPFDVPASAVEPRQGGGVTVPAGDFGLDQDDTLSDPENNEEAVDIQDDSTTAWFGMPAGLGLGAAGVALAVLTLLGFRATKRARVGE